MTPQEAYNILSKDYPMSRVNACLDYGNFYVFSLTPVDIPTGETYYTGTVMDAVDKKTKKVFKYDLTSDIDAYEKATNVSVTDVFSQKI